MTLAVKKPHKCQHCFKTFSEIRNRNRHITLVHSGLSNTCDHCNKSFEDLQAHILSFHSDKSIKCTKCDKFFGQLSRMKQHKRLVHKVLPKNCKHCKKPFKDVEGHILSAHSIKTLKCNMCDKSYGKASILTEHMTRKHGEKGFVCSGCIKEFNSAHYLKIHFSTVHKKERP